MKKIAFILTKLVCGGASEVSLSIIDGLKKNGFTDVTVISGSQVGFDDSWHYSFSNECKNKIIVPHLVREINIFFDFIALLEIYKNLKKNNFDIVHTHNSKANFLGCIAARFAGIKLIVCHEHNPAFNIYRSELKKTITKKLCGLIYKFADIIITPTYKIRNEIIRECSVEPGKIKIVYNGTDLKKINGTPTPNKMTLLKDHNIKEGDILIGQIGRLVSLKGHLYLIKSAKTILKKYSNVKFIIIGSGEEKKRLMEIINRLHLQSKFIFTGIIDRNRVIDYIKCLDVVIHPSVTEGMSLALIKAILCNKPIVTFDMPYCKEYLGGYDNAFMVPSKNIQALSNQIISVLQNLSVQGNYNKNKNFDIERFSVDAMVNSLINIYNNGSIYENNNSCSR